MIVILEPNLPFHMFCQHNMAWNNNSVDVKKYILEILAIFYTFKSLLNVFLFSICFCNSNVTLIDSKVSNERSVWPQDISLVQSEQGRCIAKSWETIHESQKGLVILFNNCFKGYVEYPSPCVMIDETNSFLVYMIIHVSIVYFKII